MRPDRRLLYRILMLGICLVPSLWAGTASAQSITPAAPMTAPQSAPSSDSSAKQRDIVDGAPLSTSNLPSSNGSGSAPAPRPRVGDNRTLEESFTGIVAPQVMTLVGQNFYDYFVAAWRALPLSDRYNISIHERPSARWGSLVWVEFQHRRLFDVFLSPARSNIRQAGERAADVVYQNIVRTDIERLLFREQDLGPDEL
jgi:curli production assembly/transport component CsgE